MHLQKSQKKLQNWNTLRMMPSLYSYRNITLCCRLAELYCSATEVSHDFGRLAFAVNKQLRNRLRGDLSQKGQLRNGFIKEKYGASKQLRFLHGRPIVPLGYVQPKNAQHKRKAVNKYTAEGRKQIHQNLKFNTSVMLWIMRNPVKSRTVEYAD